ncbi:hypothetical protein SUS17_2074 [Sphingomonas sp. S17]|nr:hypothetical protein SUS17_2074 [Sphingomonas sp. S17]
MTADPGGSPIAPHPSFSLPSALGRRQTSDYNRRSDRAVNPPNMMEWPVIRQAEAGPLALICPCDGKFICL